MATRNEIDEAGEWCCPECDEADRTRCQDEQPCDTCGEEMSLNDGCEWPENGLPLLCWSCAHDRINELLAAHSKQ